MVNIAIIPCKTGSKRLDNKNFLELGGKPMYAHTVDFAVSLGIYDIIILSTDDKERFPSIPSNVKIHLRSDKNLMKCHAFGVVKDVLSSILWDSNEECTTSLLLPTAPFRQKQSFMKAHSMLCKGAQCVVGVKRANTLSASYRYLEEDSNILRPIRINEVHNINPQSTDIEEYLVTGSLFIGNTTYILQHDSFHCPDTQGIVLEELESVDINTELDYEFARFLIQAV